MFKKLTLFVALFVVFSAFSQSDSKAIKSIKEFQSKINKSYSDKEKSPLMPEDLKKFKSLDFFKMDLKYRVEANFLKNQFPIPFEMQTTTDRKPKYQKYGTLFFEIDGVKCKLTVYQNIDLTKQKKYKNYLFVPFTDLTNNNESYGGGRYMDIQGPLDNKVILDFNQAYNPYCAYNHKYSCPIVPSENKLNVEIKAGVKKFH
jgi:hypothetical protein